VGCAAQKLAYTQFLQDNFQRARAIWISDIARFGILCEAPPVRFGFSSLITFLFAFKLLLLFPLTVIFLHGRVYYN
jgi:hypothetical protein